MQDFSFVKSFKYNTLSYKDGKLKIQNIKTPFDCSISWIIEGELSEVFVLIEFEKPKTRLKIKAGYLLDDNKFSFYQGFASDDFRKKFIVVKGF